MGPRRARALLFEGPFDDEALSEAGRPRSGGIVMAGASPELGEMAPVGNAPQGTFFR